MDINQNKLTYHLKEPRIKAVRSGKIDFPLLTRTIIQGTSGYDSHLFWRVSIET